MSKLFEMWAPEERIWSQWTKPVVFAYCALPPAGYSPAVDWPVLEAPNDRATALIVDLPRQTSVEYGIAAARAGFWPVPLFNCASGPGAVLQLSSLLERVTRGAEELSRLSIPLDAPPAFLVDSKRMQPEGPLLPGNFDNRYILLPQDFPSAGFLKAHGIRRVIWVRSNSRAAVQPKASQEDLDHVLCRWQEGGIELHAMDIETGRPEPIRVVRPSGFRGLFYRAFALIGLRRNSAGGFGAIIPQPSSGG